MSKQLITKQTPKHRFPNFRNEGGWEEKSLEDVVEFLKGKGISKSDIVPNGKQPCIRYGELYTHYNEIIDTTFSFTDLLVDDLILSKEYDVIIPSSGETQEDIAKASCVLRSGVALGGDLNILRSSINGIFLAYYLTHIKNREIAKLAQGNAVVHLYLSQLKKLKVIIPKSKSEQNQIADCLSSLDDVITYESQKLDLLKDHKKSLLQNLFPQENQTVPKLRFKEFEDAGEWEAKELNELGNLINGLTYSPNDVRRTGLLVLRSSNIQNGQIDLNDCVFVDPAIKGANLTKPDDILVCVRNGSKALIGKNAVIPKDIPFATHGAFMTVFTANYPKFVFQLFQTDAYDDQVKADLGATINSINDKNFLKYKFLVPNPKEQEKIASCLSSLDELINVQSQKVEVLKLHKKGLLQACFLM